MDPHAQQIIAKIKEANNVLVTVSRDPSVDQLSACIGLTLALNKLGKHATAVFSGQVPSTLEFLEAERTLEKNTDSLRDFIIAIDKSKADKLRYKVEDQVVKIFITPYKTSISDADLEFSQGDFNVDVIVALGVHSQADLDEVITAHGRILHDATVITINLEPGQEELGGINWLDPGASSLSQLATEVIDNLDKKVIDNQIATALLTGIVAATERFSNQHTSPKAMSVSAELMAAGADQQLVATKLAEPVAPPEPIIPSQPEDTIEFNNHPEDNEPQNVQLDNAEEVSSDPGSLDISHDLDLSEGDGQPPQLPQDSPSEPQASADEPQAEVQAQEQPSELPEPPTPPKPEPEDFVLPADVAAEINPIDAQPEAAAVPSDDDVLEIAAPQPSQQSTDSPTPPAPVAPTVNIDYSNQGGAPPQIHIDEHGMIVQDPALPDNKPSETPKIIKEHNIMRVEPQDGGEAQTSPSGESSYAEDNEAPSGGAPGGGNSFIIGAHAPAGQNTTPEPQSNAPVFEPSAQPSISPPSNGTLADLEQQVGVSHSDNNQVPQIASMPAPMVVEPTVPPPPMPPVTVPEEPRAVVGSGVYDPNSPPPVPPPMMPTSGY